MKVLTFFLLTYLWFACSICDGQNNDAIKITEARLALEKYKDCPNALAALNEVSEQGRNNSLFHLYAGKTYDCLQKFDNAIYYYELYLKVYPAANDILQRVAELRYEKRKKENVAKNLEGTWYNEDNKIRKIVQDGNNIKLYDPEDGHVKFEGTLSQDGTFRGGRYYNFIKLLNEMRERHKNEHEGLCGFGSTSDKVWWMDKSSGDKVVVSENGQVLTLYYRSGYVQCDDEYNKITRKTECECNVIWEDKIGKYRR